MNDRELISALMDGELEGPDHDRALDLLARQPELAETWRRWQLVRSSLRHEASDTVDLSARVAERLADEPVILAPRAVAPAVVRTRLVWGGALAASLALAVGLWLTAGNESPSPAAREFAALYNATPQVTVVSEGTPATETPRPVRAAAPVVARTLDDADRENAYIVAHAEYAHRGLQTGLRNFARVAVADDPAADLAEGAL
jgi:sigma-E factor negative regulatory protein RseA